ncbi:non-ribosomal peptide synthetase [Pseudonocardia sp. TRM90224]|uniref:non-ribosomal peptide synthetase n=1 Tax=Pseudonocardia sp. TRM90224 TaxID=2812678 RepID=UPI001E4046A7|nr:non-ribosomal peptide synthetase [Pseudonocardia sp. TRM90224]
MIIPASAQRLYWNDLLDKAGRTTIPRWPGPGTSTVAEHVEPIPAELPALRPGQLPAAHAVVLAALSGEREVTAGYVTAPGAPAVPLRLGTEATWRELVTAAARAEQWVLGCHQVTFGTVAAERAHTAPLFETELALNGSGTAAPLAPQTVLQVAIDEPDPDGPARLRLRYRTDAIDADAAARIAGYHVTALTQQAADPAARPATLLSAAERTFQIDGLAGPERDLPDKRFHELFEQRVAAHPDAIAAEHEDRRWTYRELNSRANRLARALQARGLRREGVVAVVSERNLDWLAAVLAVFKAGGVYLPIEPQFPAERIATTLTRSECGLALTEQGSDEMLAKALVTATGTRAVLFEEAYAEARADDDLRIPVAADQLAYIYFTSGSTGEPKGAMCEHAGMLNHLLAKIEDLGIAEGAVVAQIAPQCFDISLWQLVSALLVGGRTVILPQDTILDAERFVDEITDRRVAVLQVVPSYLEVIATYLEHRGRELPDLRIVSATGEALKFDIVQRWFAVVPAVPLVNAYGLTETSDDTNHEVLRRPPPSGRISLGPAVRNVRVYVVDPDLNPVPLGAPGLIAFSGVCVGRGYVNDPERTSQCYLTDPHKPGQRLYLGGDYGRWLPDGKLEFLGRRDSQVKIRGFRIEIGEIESALLQVPDVRDAAVVVAQRPDGSSHLVAFYAAESPILAEELAWRLGETLPDYMVPVAFHWQITLPLTPNGKIDTKTLQVFAAELADMEDEVVVPPSTATETMLATAFAEVLGVPVDQIGRNDNFFDRGGTSLTAVKLAIATGRVVGLKAITQHPVLADLAAQIDRSSA